MFFYLYILYTGVRTLEASWKIVGEVLQRFLSGMYELVCLPPHVYVWIVTENAGTSSEILIGR